MTRSTYSDTKLVSDFGCADKRDAREEDCFYREQNSEREEESIGVQEE